MWKSVSIAALLGTGGLLSLAYTLAPLNVTPLPEPSASTARIVGAEQTQVAEAAPAAPVAEVQAEAASPAPAVSRAENTGSVFTSSPIIGAAYASNSEMSATVLPAGFQGKGGSFGLGREAAEEEVAAWDIDIRPDGAGLPEGSGDVMTGEPLYTDNCAVCHGDFGEAVGRWPVLAGGKGSLTNDRPVKTIGSYWPYLSTVFDYVHRAMPFGNAQSLSDDDVYAITAYLLYLNDLVDEDFTLSNENFAEVRLPNEENFYLDDRAETELNKFEGEVCMSDCKETVEIVARAAVVDVTPEDQASREARESADSGVTETDASPAAAPAEAKSEEAAAAPAEAEVKVAATSEGAAAEEAATAAPVDPELVAKGEKVFRKCKACHQVGDNAKNKTGPLLNGVVGQKVGAVDGFRYSSAMEEAGAGGMVWTVEELHAFLEKPRSHMKGTKMSFSGLKKESDREAVIAYLNSFE